MLDASNKKQREQGNHNTALLKISSSQCVIKLTSFLNASCKALDTKTLWTYGRYLFRYLFTRSKKPRTRIQGSQTVITTTLQIETEFLTLLLPWILSNHYELLVAKNLFNTLNKECIKPKPSLRRYHEF